jgi:glycosyltransferase involved in cell wall biosynthesis
LEIVRSGQSGPSSDASDRPTPPITGAATPAPRVSVIMPIYNQIRFVPKAIDSILSQTFRDLELILVDDGSTDGVSAVLDDVARTDNRVRVHHKSNGGISSATNHGFAMSRGGYIALFDGDDIAFPHRLDRQVGFLDANHDIGMVGSNMIEIDAKDRQVGEFRYPSRPDEIYATMIDRSIMGGPTQMMRREIVEAVGGWRTEFDFVQDYDFCLRFNEKARIANLNEFLVAYRRHPNQTSKLRYRRQLALSMVARVAALCRRAGRPDPIRPGMAMDASLADRLPLTPGGKAELLRLFARARDKGQSAETPRTAAG